ncbi:HNH endonuclease [Bacillus infantis]|uniref:HNH endonuclease n=1 Tax=Bacillus infantis TaxID=324767 RepID=UPI003CF46336
MPSKLYKPCGKLGCPELTKDRYCEAHYVDWEEERKAQHKEYKRNRTDNNEQDFYNSTKWRKTRLLKLKMNPLCELCLKDKQLKPADMVDHIKPIKQGGARLEMSNLQSLCHSHHNSKTAKEI